MKGRINDIAFQEKLLEQFAKKFVDEDKQMREQRRGVNLIWPYIKVERKLYDTEKLFASKIPTKDKNVYFYDERAEQLFYTKFEDVCNYINDLIENEPWIEVDADIFPESFSWLISVTHEDVSFVSCIDLLLEEYDYDKYILEE